jgi:hypothetical protein
VEPTRSFMGRIARDWSTRLSHHTLQYDEKVVIYCIPRGKSNYHRYVFPGYFRWLIRQIRSTGIRSGLCDGDGYSAPPNPKAARSKQSESHPKPMRQPAAEAAGVTAESPRSVAKCPLGKRMATSNGPKAAVHRQASGAQAAAKINLWRTPVEDTGRQKQNPTVE